jgi:hypothetical protein
MNIHEYYTNSKNTTENTENFEEKYRNIATTNFENEKSHLHKYLLLYT